MGTDWTELMGVLQKSCSHSEMTGAMLVLYSICVWRSLYHIYMLQYICIICKDFMQPEQESVSYTEKMSFIFYFNTTDTRQRTVCNAHTVQSHRHPEKKELSAFQPIPSVTLHNGDEMPQLMGILLKTGSKMPLSSSEELLLLLKTV